jgi:alcohol dehydrogenase
LHLDYWHAGSLAVERLHTNTEPLTKINEGLDAPAAGTIIRRLFQA